MALTKIKLNEVETKATPVLADCVLLSDSADGGRGKISTLSDLQTLIGGGGGGGAVDSVAGKTGVVTLDASDIAETAALKIMTADERTKLTGIAEGAEVNTVDSVAGKTGVVTLDADDVDPTSSKLWMSDTQSAKLAGIAENANNYTHPETHPQSMITGLVDALAEKAPLASPALTGTPTAPTAAAGTNTTQLATTAFVQTAAAAKANDADAVKLTGNQSIGGTKTFTTSPVMPTPTAGDNTTKGATTEFVQAAVAACRPKHTWVLVNTASTSIAAERGNTYGINADSCTLNLPDINTAGYVAGDEISVVIGLTAARELTIVSPNNIFRGNGQQPANTPFSITGFGTVITFTRCSETKWSMTRPEYELSLKAPLASPALTGTPTAPTAAPGTNTTQIATTAFVQAAVSGALMLEGTPSGPTASGTKGMARFDADYFYVCTATNTWVRFPKDGSWTE